MRAEAQIPDTFTNLQVLPKDTSKAELTSTMRRFAFALGVRCEYCHVENADKKFDYATDDKQEKRPRASPRRRVGKAADRGAFAPAIGILAESCPPGCASQFPIRVLVGAGRNFTLDSTFEGNLQRPTASLTYLQIAN